jgi:hypothetical protein
MDLDSQIHFRCRKMAAGDFQDWCGKTSPDCLDDKKYSNQNHRIPHAYFMPRLTLVLQYRQWCLSFKKLKYSI